MANRMKKYNPAFLAPEELVRSFVVRHIELDLIMQVIRENVTQSNQHIIVIGPRGIGKTMLVLRVVEKIREEEDLRERWYPLVFGEESYQVSTPGEFWLEALFHLAHKTKEERWLRTYEELRDERDEERLRERALAQLMDFADAEGTRILLVVENFNMLLGDQISDSDAWKLRHTLLHESRIMLLATATSRFEEIENAEKAMFELFKLHDLQPLDEEECGRLWASITRKEASDERVRPLQILTGGNPRLLAIISTFAKKMSLKELMDDLMQLVDDNTEYFKSHLDSLPAIERKVYLALAELWDPATARRVADFARVNVNKASSLLRRLMERGMVVEADGHKRTKLYQVAERMYNIYYLMRRRGAPSRRVKGLVRFMVPFYGPKELVSLTQRIAEEACRLEPGSRREHFWAYEAILDTASVPSLHQRLIEAAPHRFFDMPDIPPSIKQHVQRERAKKLGPRQVEFVKLLDQGEDLEEAGKLTEAEVAYRKAIATAPENATPWAKLGNLLHKVERYEEAENACREAIRLDPDCPAAWLNLGCLLVFHLHRLEGAEEVARRVVELLPENDFGWVLCGYVHQSFERYVDAEEAYRTAIKMDEKSASAWVHLGQLLHEKLERYEEAEEAYRKAIEIDEKYIWAWAQLGQLLHEKLERYEEAEEAYRKAIELQPDMPVGWVILGGLLHRELERYEEAEKAYRKALALQPKVAVGWVTLGLLLGESLNRDQEAEEAYRKAAELEPENGLAWVLIGRHLQVKGGRPEEAEKMYRRAIEVVRGNPPAFLKVVIEVLMENAGWFKEALELSQSYVQQTDVVRKDVSGVIELFVGLAAGGYAKEALEILRGCASVEILEPLVVGLRMYVGEDVKSAAEIMEVGKDVVKRIEERRKKIQAEPDSEERPRAKAGG